MLPLQSSVRLKILVRQIISFMVDGTIDYDKVLKLAGNTMSDVSDLKGAIAAILFMVKNAAKFDVDEYTFLQEIQQLGLPKENAEAISKQYRDAKDAIQTTLHNTSYRVLSCRICDFRGEEEALTGCFWGSMQLNRVLGAEWRVDRVIGSSDVDAELGTSVHVKFTVDSRPQDGALDASATTAADGKRVQELAVEMSGEKLQVLLHELQNARRVMESLEG